MTTPQERKERSEQKILKKGIGINKYLPMIPPSNTVKLRDIDDVCKRAIAALLSIQIAFEISNQNYKDVKFFIDLMDNFNVRNCLNPKEQNLVNAMFSQQDVTDVVWEYECYWSLVWALGLIDNIEDAGSVCDCEKAVHLVADCGDFEEFKSKCRMRDVEEILDMLDLYYRYHWATVQHRWIDDKLPIGNLNEEVVYERRRGLEWLISDTDNWFDISLDT